METHLLLKKYFEKKKRSSRGLSLRALAKKMDVSAPFLSSVLNGRKSVPYSLLLKLGKALNIEPEVMANLKSSHQVQIGKDAAPRRGKAQIGTELKDWELAADQSERVLRNWFYLPILDITTLENFDGSAEMIARRLGLSLAVVELAVRDLQSLGLLILEKGRLKKNALKIRWGSATSKEDIRRFHGQMLDKAKNELQNATSEEDFQKRLIAGITLTASSQEIEQAKTKLINFLYDLANDLTKSQGTEVYHLGGQFFPLTKGK